MARINLSKSNLIHHYKNALSIFVNMDSLTQIVLGGAVGELVAGKKMGNKAVLWGAVAGTIPDLDVFFRVLYHPIEAALVHRGFSHSILFALLAGPSLGWLFNNITKNRFGVKTWFNLFFWGIITHPMLDMFTNYGTQFFWPFEARITFNSVFVIDPLYTIPFMVLLIWAMRLDKESAKRRKLNRIGLIYSTCYLLLGVLIKCYVWYDATKFLRDKKISVNRMMVTPMPFTSFYWYVLAENNNEYRVNYRSIFKSNLDTAVVIQRGRMRIQDLAWDGKNFSPELQSVTNGYYYIEQHRDTIITYDLRFGLLTKLTNGKSNLPIMGYQMEAKNHKIIKTIPLSPRKQLAKVDFKQYFKAVFGLNESFPQ